jgi:hypothetical protein
VSSTLLLLLFLVAISPVLLVFDTQIAALLLTLWTAASLGLSARSVEAEHAWRTVRVLLPLALVPAIWMAIQILPTPYLAHPIWQSAAGAFDSSLSGKISADPGLTFQALLRYVTVIGIVLVALCVALDRRRAHFVLRLLIAVTGFLTVVSILIAATEFKFNNAVDLVSLSAAFGAIRNLGMLLSASLIVGALDQYQLRRQGARFSAGMVAELCAGGAVFALCFLTTAIDAPRLVFVAGICGLIPVFLVAFLRHVPSRGWEKIIVVAIVLTVAVVMALSRFDKDSGDIALRAATGATPAQTAIAARMVADAGPLGMGAGTYAALVPSYRGIDDPPAVFAAPSGAAAIEIELGRSALAVVLLIGSVLAIVLFRRALVRGRDSLYAAAGSGCVVLLILQMFCDASPTAASVVVLAAVTIGLGLGQSVSLPRG